MKAVQSFNFEFFGDFYKKFYDNESFLLYYLCFYDYPKFVQLLITHKNIDLDSFANSHTLKNEHNLRYQYHEDFEQSDKSKIIDAITGSFSEIVKFFTATNKNIEPNTSRTTYRTALHIAIEMEYLQVVKMLLERPDIDVNAVANFDDASFNFSS